MMLSAGLIACTSGADSSGSGAATETATSTVEESTAEEVAALPAEFTMPIGEGLELGDPREDAYLGQAVTDFDLDYEGPLTYQPIQVGGDAHWLTFDRSADYAQQGDRSVHETWPDYLVDRVPSLLVEANTAVAEPTRTATDALLGDVLFTASNHMTNRCSRSDG
ncbi:hypothetical protein [Brachybacterium sp. J144]|uniref:hypothetical protein n=1 Tax=Brachybacterium sp. J144 TaxID=3116487 RepID=UPI002E762318|nr:hypothetical protein [Brachybacterium sp. J144]